ncbi:MAG: UbiX family flavin prenyltransferase [Alphaproteobacteria bacterium]|nr:MAG: UbiX family flavin prenyltransferase [Alphaproteobacteria bacterium]
MVEKRERIIVGITGASGIQYAVRILEILRDLGAETHLVMSKAAEVTCAYETDLSTSDIVSLADVKYGIQDIASAIASGSFKTRGMIVAPCSIRSMSEIATGVTSNLLTRAADVCLKERRKLVLMVRESPLHAGHLRNMAALSDLGAVIAPPLPAFYLKPQSVDDIITQTAERAIELLGIDVPDAARWGETAATGKRPRD